ncbi:nuclear transport factor 2 family protein [Shewanella sp. SR44-3]|uniref:nuclear transport factor 2 family protein n=1 Tax=unclassified Shewanella TaxID=196818 RepID=UPI0015F9156A|nr:nuclear transport factor 2 family protein [Shewanella sp. SR44-3]MBB1269318.1 nuclear transport factor 2 family protein [Shewanella sp. SR44-3]
MAQAPWLSRFITVYSTLGTDNLASLSSIYHTEVVFVDPMHKVEGIAALLGYFEQMYQQVISCDFVIEEVLEAPTQAAVYWTMTLRHTALAGGKPIKLDGHSQLKMQDQRVIYHRDYFDLGAMLYEQVPLLGTVIKYIKQRAGQ